MVTGMRLDTISEFCIAPDVITATLQVLREFGEQGCEGLVLWIGEIHSDTARVHKIVVPDQTPLKSEQGVGYFVEAETLFNLNRNLSEAGLQLIAQVHSHPTEAYHSDADDRYAIVTANGGLSLVVPNFGDAPADPAQWAVYRLSQAVWRELQPSEVRSSIVVQSLS